MIPFSYHRPKTLPEVWRLMADHPGRFAILAGGTDLLVGIRKGRSTPQAVIDLKSVKELPGDIRPVNGSLRVGALAHLTDLLEDPRIRRSFPALVEAVQTIGSVQIRNRATLAGNICNASPAADSAPALLVYGATVNLAGPAGERSVLLQDFFTGPGRTVMQPDEVVCSIDLPVPPEPSGSAFVRLTRRRGFDLATVSVSCLLSPGQPARFGFGAVAPTPLLVVDEARALDGLSTTGAGQDQALSGLLALASPITRCPRDPRVPPGHAGCHEPPGLPRRGGSFGKVGEFLRGHRDPKGLGDL